MAYKIYMECHTNLNFSAIVHVKGDIACDCFIREYQTTWVFYRRVSMGVCGSATPGPGYSSV